MYLSDDQYRLLSLFRNFNLSTYDTIKSESLKLGVCLPYRGNEVLYSHAKYILKARMNLAGFPHKQILGRLLGVLQKKL